MKVIKEKKKLIVLISIIVLAILIGVGVAVNATGSSSGIAKSVTFSEDMNGAYVYFRAVDAAGNKGEWSEPQRVWIDTTAPIISAKQESVEVEEGASNDLETYFNIDENGASEISSITFVDKSDGDKVVENTSELAVGTHEIEATVEKANGAKATATVIIVIAVLGYTLTFISNGSTYATITETQTIRFPETDPTITGCTFTGWYYDETKTQQANVGDTVTQNINLYAGWQSYITNKVEHIEYLIWDIIGYDGIISWCRQAHFIDDSYGSNAWPVETVYIYEGTSEIDYMEIDKELTDVTLEYSGSWETEVIEELYTEGNALKIKLDNKDIVNSAQKKWEIHGNVGIKVYFKDGSFDSDIIDLVLQIYAACLVYDTQITLANRTTKSIQDVTYEDELLVWDLDKAQFTSAKPLWIQKTKIAQSYNLLKFDNGEELKTIHQHRIMNKEMGKFTYPMSEETPIGTTTFTDEGTEAKLISKEVVEEQVTYYNIITDYHMNLFANGILTSCRLSNLYPIEDMKYIKDNRELLTNEDYPNMPEEYFKGLRMAEQPKVANRDNDVKFFEDWEGYVQNLIHNAVPRDEDIKKS